MLTEKPPALLIAYNRPEKTKSALESIYKSGIRHLYVSVDGPKNEADSFRTSRVLEVISQHSQLFDLCKVQMSDLNRGCKAGCFSAIDWFFSQVPFGIIVEDDVKITTEFVNFVAQFSALKGSNIWHINGWSLFKLENSKMEYYATSYGHVWGWATWADKWQYVKRIPSDIPNRSISNSHNKKILSSLTETTDTWDYFWLLSIESGHGDIISPLNRLTTNIGFDDEATHLRLKSWKQDREPIRIWLRNDLSKFPQENLDRIFEILYLREFGLLPMHKLFLNYRTRTTLSLLQRLFIVYLYEKLTSLYLKIKNIKFPILR